MSGPAELRAAQLGVTLEVWSDFVCPYCYLAFLTLKRLEVEEEVRVAYRAFELRPPGSPPTPLAVRERIERMRPQFREMARAHYGLAIDSGPFGVPSRAAHIGAAYAETQGKRAAYSARVYEAYWLRAQDISAKDVLTQVAEETGLEGAAFLAALEDEGLKQQVFSEEAQAHDLGLSGVPATVIDRRYLVSGAQPYKVFKGALEQARGLAGPTCAANGDG